MFFHVQKLINPIVADEPDPAAANALQEGLGGQFGEMCTMMQYLFQSFNFRGDAKPYFDLIQGVGIEEISHVELIATTINRLFVDCRITWLMSTLGGKLCNKNSQKRWGT
jgi:Mn-containing catalase